MENVAEDWGRLQLGMRLQIGILQSTSDWSFAFSRTQKKKQENKFSNVLVYVTRMGFLYIPIMYVSENPTYSLKNHYKIIKKLYCDTVNTQMVK